MSIKCRICDREFNKLITSTHLKTHNMLTKEYKNLYGNDSLACPLYKQERSLANSGKNNPNFNNTWSVNQKENMSTQMKGRPAWNKGLDKSSYSPEHQLAITRGIASREDKYESGKLVRPEINHTDSTKSKISDSIKLYAANNKHELKQRTIRAIQTKKENNYDFAFFKGKKHTKESKEKMVESSRISAKIKSDIANVKILERAKSINITIVSDITNTQLELFCNSCNNYFSLTKQYFHESKIKGDMCPFCHPRQYNRSQAEIEIYEYVTSLCPDAISSCRTALGSSGKEIDIFIPSLNIGIEFNGMYWHSEIVNLNNSLHKQRDYHKHQLACKHGIQLITIYDEEYRNSKNIVLSRLSNILGKTPQRIYARKCTILQITSETANTFLKQHHLQGSGRSNARYGLFYNNELVSVMTFSKDNISRKIKDWELNRFCTIKDTTVVGGAARLLNRFMKEYSPDKLISYSDNRWSSGNVYKQLGFKFSHVTPPNYWYFKPNEYKRYHRYNLRKTDKDDCNLTEWENRISEGWNRIWDCGNTKWILEKLTE